MNDVEKMMLECKNMEELKALRTFILRKDVKENQCLHPICYCIGKETVNNYTHNIYYCLKCREIVSKEEGTKIIPKSYDAFHQFEIAKSFADIYDDNITDKDIDKQLLEFQEFLNKEDFYNIDDIDRTFLEEKISELFKAFTILRNIRIKKEILKEEKKKEKLKSLGC